MQSFSDGALDCELNIKPNTPKFTQSPEDRRRALEEKIESARCLAFQTHLKLIDAAASSDCKALSQQISETPALTQPTEEFRDDTLFKGLPETKDKKQNIFLSVFANPNLSSDDRLSILKLLFSKGYKEFFYKLLESPIIDNMLEDAKFLKNINYLYALYLNADKSTLEDSVERKIWKHLIKNLDINNCENLFRLMLQNYEKRLRAILFAKDWIYSTNSRLDTISIYRRISLAITNYRISIFDVDFNKMAKQHILQLELSLNSDPVVNKNPVQLDRVVTFLSTHRDSYFTCFRTSSRVIYDNIHKEHDLKTAQANFNEENKAMAEELSIKLAI